MTNVVLGGGLVGSEIAKILLERGEDLVVVTRTSREILPGLFTVSADATNPADLDRVAPNVTRVFNSLNAPNYTRWHLEFPPLNTSVLNYATRTGAELVSVSNLYMYDSSLGPIAPGTPVKVSGEKGLVRQKMWEETQRFIDRGLRAAEVRASDYIAHGEQSPLGDRFTAPLTRDKTPSVIGKVDKKHSWTAPKDVALTCIEVLQQSAFGRVWHVPTNPPKTFQEVSNDIRCYLGKDPIEVKSMPGLALAVVGAFVPIVRAVKETAYQFNADFIIDDRETREALSIQPTAWTELVEGLVDCYL